MYGIIDGSVEGLIELDEQKLMFGATAKVTADIIAREVVVVGNVNGNLRAKDRIEIKKDGSVTGDLTTARIMIEDGAYFRIGPPLPQLAGFEATDGPTFRAAIEGLKQCGNFNANGTDFRQPWKVEAPFCAVVRPDGIIGWVKEHR